MKLFKSIVLSILAAFAGLAQQFNSFDSLTDVRTKLAILNLNSASNTDHPYIVANGAGTWDSYNNEGTTSAIYGITTRRLHKIFAFTDRIQLVYSAAGSYYAASNPKLGETNLIANPFDLVAAVELSDGTVIPVSWGYTTNGMNRLLKGFGAGEVAVSDVIHHQFNPGDTFWTRTFINRSASTTYQIGDGEYGTLAADQTALPFNFTTSGAAANLNTGDGHVRVTTTSANPFGTAAYLPYSGTVTPDTQYPAFIPLAVVGYPNVAGANGIAIFGDSIAQGAGDVLASEIGGGRGFIRRALDQYYPILQLAARSEQLVHVITKGYAQRRFELSKTCRFAWCEYPVNDLNGGMTAATAEADLLIFWSQLQQQGLKVAQSTITPYTTSSDYWQTTGNQTFTTGSAAGNTLNAWLRAGAPILITTTKTTNSDGTYTKILSTVSYTPTYLGAIGAVYAGKTGHPLSWVVDTAAAVESSVGSGLWAPSTTYQASGTATASTTTTQLNDSGQAWPATGNGGLGGLVGYTLINTTRSAARQITANTATSLTINAAIASQASGDSYLIIKTPVYQDDTSGVHPSAYGHSLMANVISTNMFQ